MRHRNRTVLEKALEWLAALPAPPSLDAQIERLFGMWACIAVSGGSRRRRAALGRIARELEPFQWFQYQGDPVPPLAVCRALKWNGLHHASLSALNDGYCAILRDEEPALLSNLGMICDLLRENGGDAPDAAERHSTFPDASALVAAGRNELVDLSRTIMMATSCGRLPLEAAELRIVLPSLAFSYARDWDLECTSALLRACAYLHVADAPACRWTVEWLLDQQQSDGRFGFENKMGGQEDHWSSLRSTVAAVWSIAELNEAGFILG